MCFIRFMQSVPGRLLRVALGVWLIAFGATHVSLLGLVLMMVGIVPAVTGFAGICLLEEVMKGQPARHVRAGRPSEHRA
jgi:hypothetical protein